MLKKQGENNYKNSIKKGTVVKSTIKSSNNDILDINKEDDNYINTIEVFPEFKWNIDIDEDKCRNENNISININEQEFVNHQKKEVIIIKTLKKLLKKMEELIRK